MPIYEYLCEGCGRVSEVFQKVSDPPPATCSECGSKRLAKIVSRTAFQLKGGGWYADLYASTDPKKKGKDGGEAKAGGEAGSAEKPAAPSPKPGETKPAPAPTSAKGGG